MILNLRKISSLHSKRNRLMSCLSMSTMCLLITASIVIITIISITPIIILSLGRRSLFTFKVKSTPVKGILFWLLSYSSWTQLKYNNFQDNQFYQDCKLLFGFKGQPREQDGLWIWTRKENIIWAQLVGTNRTDIVMSTFTLLFSATKERKYQSVSKDHFFSILS